MEKQTRDRSVYSHTTSYWKKVFIVCSDVCFIPGSRVGSNHSAYVHVANIDMSKKSVCIFGLHLWTHCLLITKLYQYLCFHADNDNLEFRWLATWFRCVSYMRGWAFHMYGKVYTFYRFLALNSTHIIIKAPNLFSTFVLKLIMIILSFVSWRHGWGVFRTWEDELFTCTAKCTHFTGFWPSIPHTLLLKHQTWSVPLFWS